jgi:prophage regulatory protein
MKLLDEHNCKEKTTLSRTQRHRLMAAGLFPKKIEITPGRTAWIEEEIDDWIAARVAASRGREGGSGPTGCPATRAAGSLGGEGGAA